MKKFIAVLSVVMIIAMLCSVTVSAHGGNGHGKGHCGDSAAICANTGKPAKTNQTTKAASSKKACVCCTEDCSFVDADSDGICDNCGSKCAFTDKDGDGKCDNCGKKCRICDYDCDGKCDLCGKTCRDGKHYVKVKKTKKSK